MTILSSRIDPGSAGFAAARDAMRAGLDQVRGFEEKVRALSASKAAKFAARGQLLPRERVARLLDPGAPFLELSTLAGLGMHDDDGKEKVAGGGSICGVGVVAGVRVMVVATDSAIKGGTVSPMGLKKTLRMQEIARQQRLPLVSLVESGGANLKYQSEIFIEGGRAFANQARLSAAGIPQIAVVHGSSTAGGAYLPGLSDYTVVVRGRSKIFLAGPPLVKAAIGEDATDEELGGATLHAETTGLAEYLAEDDAHAVALAREIVAELGWERAAAPPAGPRPRFDAEELLGVVPADPREPYDVRELIARVVDDSAFLEFKRSFSVDTVCGHARVGGHRVGIVGNNGPIQPTGSTKVAQFIQLCDQAGTPLLFVQNTTGYMVGVDAERAGAIKHGSKMIQAVANARVPKITIVVGGSFGAGNYGMCGRGFDPDFIFSWPSARTAVMGGAQAAKVMELVTLANHAAKGIDSDPAVVAAMMKPLADRLDAEAHVLFGTARLWDDGVIDPRDTRAVVELCLEVIAAGRAQPLRGNTFGVARL